MSSVQQGDGTVRGRSGEADASGAVPARERVRGRHSETHEFFDPTCFACKISTQVVVKGELSPEVADIKRRDAQLVKDRDAYKRLRADGVQPNQVDGSAVLESRAVEQIDIDMKLPIPKEHRERIKEAQAQVAMEQFGKLPS